MKRIVIVDDSAVMRKNLRLILTKEGYDVVAEAANGEEAYRAYTAYRPDLMTMDITMPVMNGIDAVRAIMRDYPEARIVVISAFDQRSMLFEAMENGAKHYIIKPITADKLLNVVRQILDTEAETKPLAPAAGQAPAETAAEPDQGSFTVENRNGVFLMVFPGRDWSVHLPMAKQALQGLLFIKPLAVQFSFPAAESLGESLFDELTAMIRQIQQAGGSVTLSAERPSLAETLRQVLPNLTVGQTAT